VNGFDVLESIEEVREIDTDMRVVVVISGGRGM